MFKVRVLIGLLNSICRLKILHLVLQCCYCAILSMLLWQNGIGRRLSQINMLTLPTGPTSVSPKDIFRHLHLTLLSHFPLNTRYVHSEQF